MLASLSVERLRHWLLSFVDIRPGEGARVALPFLYSVAAVGGVLTIGLAASDVLFMSQMPPTALPYMFILPAAAIIPVLLLYNQVAATAATPAADAANAVLEALADEMLMLRCAHFGPSYDDTGGLTTYLLPPGTGKPISPYYTETAYAQATSWGEFLAAYHEEVV